MKVYIDTREKKYEHIVSYFQEIGQEYEIRHLATADYSSDCPNGILIERKRSIIEFAGNVAANHDRFVRELKRAKEAEQQVVIIIEEPYRATAKKMVERAFKKLSTWVAEDDRESLDGIKTRCLKEVKTCDDLFLINFWSDRKCAVQGDTMYKHCKNFVDWYGVEFVFCKPENTGKIILEYLRKENGKKEITDSVE